MPNDLSEKAGQIIPIWDLGAFLQVFYGVIWEIKAGFSFKPESHNYAHILIIIKGSGILDLDGRGIPYFPGMKFDVEKCVPHGFTEVNETTLVLQMQLQAKYRTA